MVKVLGLDDTTLVAETDYSFNFSEEGKKFILKEIYYHLFVNGVRSYYFKAKDSKLNTYPLCLGNISRDFTVDNMKKTDYNSIDVVDDILDIHKMYIFIK